MNNGDFLANIYSYSLRKCHVIISIIPFSIVHLSLVRVMTENIFVYIVITQTKSLPTKYS